MKMRKKVIAVALACAMLLSAVGGTLAWLTDKDSVKNVFTVGSVDINLTETNKLNGVEVAENSNPSSNSYNYKFDSVMPGDKITKTPVITNEGKNDAYVRVVVEVKNKGQVTQLMSDNIDQYFEEKLHYDTQKMEALYDEIFDGWGINYSKIVSSGMRFWLDQRTADSQVLNIDSIRNMGGSKYWMFNPNNAFLSEQEQMWKERTADNCFGYYENDGSCPGYYADLMTKGDGKLIYVFYLDLKGTNNMTDGQKDSYTLFNGMNVPELFDTESLEFFKDLEIDIHADAIQKQGFDTWQDAIDALNEQHSLADLVAGN